MCHFDEGEIFRLDAFKILRRSFLTSLGMTGQSVSDFLLSLKDADF